MMSRMPATARAMPATIVRVVANLSAGSCAAASQIPANRMSRNPISARRRPVCWVRARTCMYGILPALRHPCRDVAAGRGRTPEREGVVVMGVTILRNASVLDPDKAELAAGQSVVVEGGRIADVGASLSAPRDAVIL